MNRLDSTSGAPVNLLAGSDLLGQPAMRFAAYVFDAYGTLFDVHAAVRRHAGKLGPDGPAFSTLWRAKQLEYSWVRSLAGAYADFWRLTEDALDFAFDAMPQMDRGARAGLLDAYWNIDCYPEAPPVLRGLKSAGARLAVLSNGSPAMLEAAVRASALDGVLDEIFSVDAVKRYKPDPAVYDAVATGWRLYPDAVSFQSSNRWDVAGAARFGFRAVWINRDSRPDEYRDCPPALILPSLEALAAEA